MKKLFIWLLPFLITCGIFILSLQDAPTSNTFTRTITEYFTTLFPSLPIYSISNFNHLLREVGHVLEYLLLSFCMLWAFYKMRFSFVKNVLFTLFSVVIISLIDEIVQELYSPGRAFQFIDLAKDWLGMLVAILIFYIFTQKKFTKH